MDTIDLTERMLTVIIEVDPTLIRTTTILTKHLQDQIITDTIPRILTPREITIPTGIHHPLMTLVTPTARHTIVGIIDR